MRIDARNLLDRLGKNDFAYKEFEDRFSELELWPMLEALLRDPRLQAIDKAESSDAPTPEPAPQDFVEAYAGESLTSLFSRYGNAGAPADSPADRRGGTHQQQDVRAMLRHLSDLGSQGKI